MAKACAIKIKKQVLNQNVKVLFAWILQTKFRSGQTESTKFWGVKRLSNWSNHHYTESGKIWGASGPPGPLGSSSHIDLLGNNIVLENPNPRNCSLTRLSFNSSTLFFNVMLYNMKKSSMNLCAYHVKTITSYQFDNH